MKSNFLLVATLVLFLLVNTSYYWEGKLGINAIPAFLLMILLYTGLVVALLYQLYRAIIDKFRNRKRNIIVSIMIVSLFLIYLKPEGIINFDRMEGKDLLIADAEGSANCRTILKLKENNKFIVRSVCFGVKQTKGNYFIKSDTVFFSVTGFNRGEEFFKFAVIKYGEIPNIENKWTLQFFMDYADSPDQILWITKNELKK